MEVKEDLMLFLTEDQVSELVGVGDALEVVEASMRELSEGKAANLPRQRMRMPTGTLHLMAAALAAVVLMPAISRKRSLPRTSGDSIQTKEIRYDTTRT